MKKMSKIVSVFTIILMLASICTCVFATDTTQIDIDSMKGQTIDEGAAGAMQSVGGTILAYITNAAMVISVVMIAVLGIKYMMGSAEEKAEYKKSLVPLLVGAILVFGAAAIAKVIVGLAGTFNTSP